MTSMVVQQKLHIAVVCAEQATLAQLQAMAHQSSSYVKCQPYTSPSDLLNALKRGDTIDVIAVDFDLGEAVSLQLVREARAIHAARDVTFIQIRPAVQPRHVDFDADIVKPATAEALCEVADISRAITAERGAVREQAAMTLLVKQIISQIDEVSYLRRCGYDARISMAALEDTCSPLKYLSPESLQKYFEIALEQFPSLGSPRVVNPDHLYKGESDRVKKKREESLAVALKTGNL